MFLSCFLFLICDEINLFPETVSDILQPMGHSKPRASPANVV